LPTLKQIRRAAAGGKIEVFEVMTTTSVSGAATELIAAEVGESDLPSTYFARAWAYGTSGNILGQQRRIASAGLNVATSKLTVTRGFSVTPASGVEFELMSDLPAVQSLGWWSWRESINDALRSLSLRRVISLTAVPGQVVYNSGLPSWLTSRAQIVGITPYAASSTLAPLTTDNVRDFRYTGSGYELVLWGSLGANADLVVYQPAITRVNTGSGPAESTTGLVADSDSVDIDLNLIRWAARANAFGWLKGRKDAPKSWADLHAEAVAVAARLKRELMVRDTEQRILKVDSATPSSWPKDVF
jgi:hypothetical protein